MRSPDFHGELDATSPPAPEVCGYDGIPAKLLLRDTLPQFPALPDLTCARGTTLLFDILSFCESVKDEGFVAEGVDGEEKSRSTSVPLKECLALGVVTVVLLRRCWNRAMFLDQTRLCMAVTYSPGYILRYPGASCCAAPNQDRQSKEPLETS